MKLSKEALLGTKFRETVPLVHPATEEKFEIQVRPLSDAEAQTVRAMQTAGLTFDGTPAEMQKGMMRLKGDLSQLQVQKVNANRKAVAIALCMDETWSEKEIGDSWPPGWVEKVAGMIYRITGIDAEPAEVRQFRQVAGGNATDDPGGAGDTAGPNGPGAHAPAADGAD